jgi:hypothetical protein
MIAAMEMRGRPPFWAAGTTRMRAIGAALSRGVVTDAMVGKQ